MLCVTDPPVAVTVSVYCPAGVAVLPVEEVDEPEPDEPEPDEFPPPHPAHASTMAIPIHAGMLHDCRRRVAKPKVRNAKINAVKAAIRVVPVVQGKFRRKLPVGPVALAAFVATVTVTPTADGPLMVAGLGDTEHVAFVGAPLQAKLTVPLNPLLPLALKL
jgi:hypothetical protein